MCSRLYYLATIKRKQEWEITSKDLKFPRDYHSKNAGGMLYKHQSAIKQVSSANISFCTVKTPVEAITVSSESHI